MIITPASFAGSPSMQSSTRRRALIPGRHGKGLLVRG